MAILEYVDYPHISISKYTDPGDAPTLYLTASISISGFLHVMSICWYVIRVQVRFDTVSVEALQS